MTILLVLIPLGLLLLGAAVAFFAWAVRNGQFDDLEDEAERILFEDDLASGPAPVRRPGSSAPRGDRR